MEIHDWTLQTPEPADPNIVKRYRIKQNIENGRDRAEAAREVSRNVNERNLVAHRSLRRDLGLIAALLRDHDIGPDATAETVWDTGTIRGILGLGNSHADHASAVDEKTIS